MRLFGKRDEAEKRFKEAIRYIDPDKKEFDLDKATMLLEEAIMLKPYEEKYRKQLEQVRTMKPNLGKKFLMHVDDVYQIKGRGTVLTGVVQQGIIRSGDRVRIAGNLGDRSDTVKGIEKFGAKTYAPEFPEGIPTSTGFVSKALPGDDVGLELASLRGDDVERGDAIEKMEA